MSDFVCGVNSSAIANNSMTTCLLGYSTSADMDSETERIHWISNLLWQIIGTTLLVIGLVGHLLSIVTTSASSTLRSHSSGVFIVSLSIVGLLTLYSGLFRQVIMAFSSTGYDIRSRSIAGCKLHLFITYLSLQLFAWLQATIALDRYIAVCHALYYNKFSRWVYGAGLVCVEVIVVMLLNSALLVSGKLSDTEDTYGIYCYTSIENLNMAWPYMDLLSFSIIPALFIIIFNCLILHNLIRRRNTNLKRHVKSLTVMLMTVNLAFLVSTVPISIVLIMDLYQPIYHSARAELGFTCTSILQYTGTASTFFIYCLTGTRFRYKIKLIFSRKSVKQTLNAPNGNTRRRSTLDSQMDQCSNHNIQLK